MKNFPMKTANETHSAVIVNNRRATPISASRIITKEVAEPVLPMGFWAQAFKRIGEIFPREVMGAWFDQLVCLEESDSSVLLGAPSDFSVIWISENYLDIIKKQCAIVWGHPVDVKISVAQSPQASVSTASASAVERAAPTSASFRPVITHRPMRSKLQLNPRYTFENYIVGSSNQLAHAASVAVAQNLARAYNPLFIYGGSGLGKTHLIQAIAHSVMESNSSANIMYLTCEKFTNDYIQAVATHSTTAFRKHYRQADVLLIDDIQFLENKDKTQEEFFHTFNELFESNKQICLTSDRPASEIAKLESRLISRFQWGMVTDIQAPDLETRIAILRRKADLLNTRIPDDILAFMAKSITRNVRRMEGALTRVASYSSLMNTAITQEKVEHLLQDILQEEAQNQLTIEKIQQKVIEYYRLRPSDMTSKRRPNAIAFPRQVAMYLCRILTTHSLQEIGENFGGRDHGTVIHACKTVENMMDQDESAKRAVELLQTQLGRRG
jgi:chromosomal replication initiator protein